jgi:hypothetical protein
MTAHYITIVGNKMLTDWMQALDLFEKFRVVAFVRFITVTYDDGTEDIWERSRALTPKIVEAIEHSKEIPVFVHLLHIRTPEAILLNETLRVPYWRNPEVRVISSGHKWSVLETFVEENFGVKMEPIPWPSERL